MLAEGVEEAREEEGALCGGSHSELVLSEVEIVMASDTQTKVAVPTMWHANDDGVRYMVVLVV